MQSTLDRFTNYIKPHYVNLNIAPENVYIDAAEINITPAGMNETKHGRHVCNFKYTISFSVDSIRNAKTTLLFCLVHAFVSTLENRARYNLSPPSVELIDVGDNLHAAEVSIEVNDEVYLTPSDDGNIIIGGTRYEIGEHTLNIAENATITGDAK